jgi:sporulation protein YlmC with PRC-barrel domain
LDHLRLARRGASANTLPLPGSGGCRSPRILDCCGSSAASVEKFEKIDRRQGQNRKRGLSIALVRWTRSQARDRTTYRFDKSQRRPVMKFYNDVHSKADQYHSAHTRALLLCMVGAAIALLIVAGPHPVFSQGIKLVKVDVQVVADGYRMSELTGHAVVNDKNESIGKIDDFVIGHDEGHSLFTVLQVGGFLGIGSRLVAVPYDSLTIDQKGNKIEKIALPGASKEQLQKLTEFRYGT